MREARIFQVRYAARMFSGNRAMAIADRLRKLRKSRELGQADVAAEMGVAIPTVSEWESGKKKPSRDRVMKLARFYGVSADWLLEDAGQLLGERITDPSEKQLLDAFRDAPDALRQAALTVLRAMEPAKTDKE